MHGHVPWSNGNIYFDGPNCCGANNRINGPGGIVAGEWTHFVFQKDGPLKQVWVNGVKTLEGGGQLPANRQHGVLDRQRTGNKQHHRIY
jgi:hypothetical protein